MIDTFAVKKKMKFISVKKKFTRRVVYKWQESAILFKRVLLLNHDLFPIHIVI